MSNFKMFKKDDGLEELNSKSLKNLKEKDNKIFKENSNSSVMNNINLDCQPVYVSKELRVARISFKITTLILLIVFSVSTSAILANYISPSVQLSWIQLITFFSLIYASSLILIGFIIFFLISINRGDNFFR